MLRSVWAAALVGPAAVLGHPAPAADEKNPTRIGRVVVEGNAAIPDGLILEMADLRPGQILDFRDLRAAPGRIARLGVFDPADPPTIELVPNEFDLSFLDIRVRVKEQAGRPAELRFRADIAYHAMWVARLCGALSYQLCDALNPWPRAAPDR
jgi:hypothetical protein